VIGLHLLKANDLCVERDDVSKKHKLAARDEQAPAGRVRASALRSVGENARGADSPVLPRDGPGRRVRVDLARAVNLGQDVVAHCAKGASCTNAAVLDLDSCARRRRWRLCEDAARLRGNRVAGSAS
jgi:hypothetical protein